MTTGPIPSTGLAVSVGLALAFFQPITLSTGLDLRPNRVGFSDARNSTISAASGYVVRMRAIWSPSSMTAARPPQDEVEKV